MVCTGNLCRSPMAQHLAAAHFPPHPLGPQEPDALPRFHSAGITAEPDAPMHPHAAALLEARGIDPSRFRAQLLTEQLIAASDLVLTATREHRSAVVGLVPRALRRTFTMREFNRLTSGVSVGDLPTDRLRAAGDHLVTAAWQARGAGRIVPVELDDLSDPVERGRERFEDCASMIGDAVIRPMTLLAGACHVWQAVPSQRRAAGAAQSDRDRPSRLGGRAPAQAGGTEPAAG